MIAPTDKSMPAVRMTRLCAAPTMPTMATCCNTSVSANGEKNFSPMVKPNPAIDASSTISGTTDGLRCNVDFIQLRKRFLSSSKVATSSTLSFSVDSKSSIAKVYSDGDVSYTKKLA